jgi:two-component system cell cycle sensor histidine kinase/response regulator CckA
MDKRMKEAPQTPPEGPGQGDHSSSILAAISEQCFRSLAETAHDAIFFTDRSASVVFWNRAAEEIFGYNAEEMAGKPLTIIVPPRLRKAHEGGIERALSGNLPVSGKTTEITGLRRDGREFPLELTLATWKSGEGTFLTAIARDITDRRRADEELRKSEERYRNIFEDSPIALWEGDFRDLKVHLDELRERGGGDLRRSFDDHPGEIRESLKMIRVVDVNRAALRMYGARRKGELAGGLETIVCEESTETFRDALLSLDEGRQVFEGESVTRSLQGEKIHVFLRWAVAPGPGKAASRLLLSIIDITAHKRLEKQLLQSQKMEAVGRLAGGVAHDFNNLLTAITTNTDLLLLELSEDSSAREAIDVISRTAEEAGKLIHQLLAVSRQQELKLEVLDLNSSLRKLQQLLPHLLGEGVKPTFSFDDDLLQVKAHPGQVEQIVLNLAVNARDAMAGGGDLSLSTANVLLGKEESPLLDSLAPGRYVSLKVTDSGCGIAPADMEHIFEPFFTTKREGGGLGLSTVYGIAKQLGGHISAASTPGRGTSFSLYLPAVKAKGRPGGGRAVTAPSRTTLP